MSLEDSNPLKKPEAVLPTVEGQEPEEKAPSIPVAPTTIEDPTQTQEAKAERETARLARIEELRQELGATGPSPENEDLKAREEKRIETDKENIGSPLRRLAESVDALSLAITHNKFPRVSFEPDKIRALGSRDTINPTTISAEFADLSSAINKITFPDSRDRMGLEPRNFKAVIGAMEEVKTRLSLLAKTFDRVESQNLKHVANEVNKIRTKVASKIDGFEEGLRLLRRYTDR
jgi:hypothetical protein